MGRPKTGTLSTFPKEYETMIAGIRTNNKGLGPDAILVEIIDEYKVSDDKLPCRSTVAKYLRENGHVKQYEKHSNLPVPPIFKPKASHEM